MATTNKGIYYQYDYNVEADVPKDMKQMAESIDELLNNYASENWVNTQIGNINNLIDSIQGEVI